MRAAVRRGHRRHGEVRGRALHGAGAGLGARAAEGDHARVQQEGLRHDQGKARDGVTVVAILR